MTCKGCGKIIKISRAIKSRVRTMPFEYKCTCKYRTTITKEDVEENNEIRFFRLTERRNKHGG